MPQHYDETFKTRIVRLRIKEGRSIKSLIEEYGISKSSISKWCNEFREKCQNNGEYRICASILFSRWGSTPRLRGVRKKVRVEKSFEGLGKPPFLRAPKLGGRISARRLWNTGQAKKQSEGGYAAKASCIKAYRVIISGERGYKNGFFLI